jgi:cobalt-zinc-cadmium efflux system outer membrane protein
VDALVASLQPAELRSLVTEALERNPEVARARAAAAAAAARAPQVRSLPDPVASLTLFLASPETRVGPQRLTASLAQRFPGWGKLPLQEQVALHHAAMLRAEVEARRLEIVTAVRRHALELAFLEVQRQLTEEESSHLVRHEEAARSRYTAGQGVQQGVIKIQAEITRTAQRLLEIETRAASLRVALNALRDRPAATPLPVLEPPSLPPLPPLPPLAEDAFPRAAALLPQAQRQRPECLAATAGVARGETLVQLAEKAGLPDLTFGVGYTLVERRQDAPGRLNPPPGDGDDIVSVMASAPLPVRKARLTAALEEALAVRSEAEARDRAVRLTLEREIGALLARLPLLVEQLELFERVLITQAEAALASAETGYATGTLGALELLDAEHVLFSVRLGAARVRTDLAVVWAELEGAVGGPLSPLGGTNDA